MSINDKEPLDSKEILLTGICALILCLVSILVLIYWNDNSWEPNNLTIGPFHGTKRKDIPARDPNQIFNLSDRKKLKVYDQTSTEIAPTVMMQDKNDKILWCIYATTNDGARLYDLRFDKLLIIHNPPIVKGYADWEGFIKTYWFINNDGKLVKYYFETNPHGW